MKEHPVFRASEILDMAIEIERQGLEFYETCLGHTNHPVVRKALQTLAEDERTHVRVFDGMKKDLEQYDFPQSYPGELQAYLESFCTGTGVRKSPASSGNRTGPSRMWDAR